MSNLLSGPNGVKPCASGGPIQGHSLVKEMPKLVASFVAATLDLPNNVYETEYQVPTYYITRDTLMQHYVMLLIYINYIMYIYS